MVEYITMNGLWYVFLQDSLIFLVVCFFSEIKEKRKYFFWSTIMAVILTILYAQINLLATGFVWLTSV